MVDTDCYISRAKYFSKSFGPGPFSAFAATIEIDSSGAEFWICMTREVRLRKKRKAGDTTGRRETMPHLFTNDLQIQIIDNAVEHLT